MIKKLIIVPAAFVLLNFIVSCNGNNNNLSHKQEHNNTSLPEYFNLLAVEYENHQAWDSAFYYYNIARSGYIRNNDLKGAAQEIIKMAEVQLTAGDYFGVENTIGEALPILKREENHLKAAYLLLASSHKNLYNNDSAIIYYRKAAAKEKNSIEKINLMHNIARCYISKGNYKKAIKILNDLSLSSVIINYPKVQSYIIDRLGYAYFKQNENEGLNKMLEALELRKKNNDSEGLFSSYLHLSEYYGPKDFTKAKQFALEAYNIAESIENPNFVLEALAHLMNYSSGSELKKYSNEYLYVETNLTKVRLHFKRRFDEISKNTKLKEAEIIRLNEARDRALLLQISSDHNKLLLVSLVFTIFSSLLIYFLVKSRHKRERFMEAYTTETRIAKKVHDEIANEIYGTINYLSTNTEIPDRNKEKLISRLDDIYLMTKNISRETNNIDTGYQYPEHLKMMLNAYSDNTTTVILKGISDIDWNTIDAIRKIATYRSLQELMVNMKKHSHATLVVISFTVANKKFKISYTDNGVGASKEKLFSKNGLLNIESRMASIGGSINFDTNTGKGFHITLIYPAYMPYV
ncbi:hypothetical protein [Flavobacterium sp. NRK1]|uniref:ATP-binding protein n=1 Tax=Flavobacterium sp. NRK1 TaxID=2954929 RepID=UPI002091F09F|nr:hypothetical protein [Flavobacterium sp. NRK1]MCO6148374.1 hypothetical protein [Flavobacterium sp. NRK1]